jgi:hypothetical protein
VISVKSKKDIDEQLIKQTFSGDGTIKPIIAACLLDVIVSLYNW